MGGPKSLNRTEPGGSVAQPRFCSNKETVSIISDLVRSSEDRFKRLAVSKLCKSSTFRNLLVDHVVDDLSSNFSRFISSDTCPWKSSDSNASSNIQEMVNFSQVLETSLSIEEDVISAICKLCFEVNVTDLEKKPRLKQRLISVLGISAFSRSRNLNLVQKALGCYFKLNGTSKQGLQLLQRLGITVVPKAITDKQDSISSSFLAEVYERKVEVELWHERRKCLESLV